MARPTSPLWLKPNSHDTMTSPLMPRVAIRSRRVFQLEVCILKTPLTNIPHDILPFAPFTLSHMSESQPSPFPVWKTGITERTDIPRSEEHTSELQSQSNLVCRLLLEKNK